jgi:hypothetical protein
METWSPLGFELAMGIGSKKAVLDTRSCIGRLSSGECPSLGFFGRLRMMLTLTLIRNKAKAKQLGFTPTFAPVLNRDDLVAVVFEDGSALGYEAAPLFTSLFTKQSMPTSPDTLTWRLEHGGDGYTVSQ